MPTEEHDSWLGDAFGVAVADIRSAAQTVTTDVGNAVQSVENVAGQVYNSAASVVDSTIKSAEAGVSSVVSTVRTAVNGAIDDGIKALKSVTGGGDSGPMQPDCKPVHGYVPGPAGHLLCQTHGHIVDVNAGEIIAASLDEYKAKFPTIQDAKDARAKGAKAAKEQAGKAVDAVEGSAKKWYQQQVDALKQLGDLLQALNEEMETVAKTIIFDCKLVTASAAFSVLSAIPPTANAADLSTKAATTPPPADVAAAAAASAAVPIAVIAIGKAVVDVGKMIDCIATNYKSEASTERLREYQQKIQDLTNKLS